MFSQHLLVCALTEAGELALQLGTAVHSLVADASLGLLDTVFSVSTYLTFSLTTGLYEISMFNFSNLILFNLEFVCAFLFFCFCLLLGHPFVDVYSLESISRTIG